ncbi:hypothetical protein C8Q74DRAFT_1381103 [Fomes fomentarius]|nr:hypothetical protein C8Q74DRAFT_1381103 [Fomes fomentarius]
MPTNITVSHTSPLLSTIPRSAWQMDFNGEPSNPTTYHYNDNTQSGNASMTFSWWGNASLRACSPVVLMNRVNGGYRNWSGSYQVTLDGETTMHEGYIAGMEEAADHVLFNATGLHTVYGKEVYPDQSVDTQITFASELYDAGVIDHTDPTCQWWPQDKVSWKVGNYSRSTNNSLGAMEMNFTIFTAGYGALVTAFSMLWLTCPAVSAIGSGIVLYGYLNPDSAPLSVTIDGQTSQPLSPNAGLSAPNSGAQVIYAVMGLLEANHTLRVENNPVDILTSARTMNIGHAQVLSMNSPSQGPIEPGTDVSPSNGETSLAHRTIVLAASFSTLGFVLLSLLLWRLTVHARRKARRERETQAARPFLARPDALASSSRSPQMLNAFSSYSSSSFASPEHPAYQHSYTRTHRSQRSWMRAAAQPRGRGYGHRHGQESTSSEGQERVGDVVGEIDTLHRSFSRMTRPRRPPPVSIARANTGALRPGKAMEVFSDTEDSTDAVGAVGGGVGGVGGGGGRQREAQLVHEVDLHRHPSATATVRTAATSPTVCDSMSVNAPLSPYSTHYHDSDLPSPRSPDLLVPGTLPLRVPRRRRGSIEKPPQQQQRQGQGQRQRQWQLVGSPVGSLPSSRAASVPSWRGALPPPSPPPPLPLPLPPTTQLPPPPPPLHSPPPGLDAFDVEWPMPPPYRLLDLH